MTSQFPGLGRLASLGSRLAAMERQRQESMGRRPLPFSAPSGPQGISNQPQQPLGAPNLAQGQLSLPPMSAGIEPKPAQPPAPSGPVLPSPPASSMIRDVKPRMVHQRTAF